MSIIYSLLEELLRYSQSLTPDEFAKVREEVSRTADFKGNKTAQLLFESTMSQIANMIE